MLECRESYRSFGRALIDPVDDLSVSRKQTVQSHWSRSRPHLVVRKINQPRAAGEIVSDKVQRGKKRFYHVTVIDTLAFKRKYSQGDRASPV